MSSAGTIFIMVISATVYLMDFLREDDKLDAIVPGVSDVYRRLRDSKHQGIYTSLGRFYNHTIFARDAGMTAKFVNYFDHQTAWDTILTLASYQGRTNNRTTQEQPGRIHHELRDFTSWKGRWYERLGLRLVGRVWGGRNKQFLTYFAGDTTASYIRLVHDYATNIDSSILDRQVPQRDGSTVSLKESVTAAANWIVKHVDQDGVFRMRRTNRWSLPYQTYCDSLTAYAWSDGRPADTSRDHSFVEVQAYALGALQDAMVLIPNSPELHYWRLAFNQLQAALFDKFWSDEAATFSPGLFDRGKGMERLDTDMITAGWTLNASIWDHMPDDERKDYIAKIVGRLFRDDMLSEFGLRTRSLRVNEPMGDIIDYHGSRTVWPMFNFMIIEGLRRHGLYRLARQLEFRILNGINATGGLSEFMIVDHDGQLFRADRHAVKSRRSQMIPEQNIAFTVVPAMTLAYRHLYKRHEVAETGWEFELEESILKSIAGVELLAPAEAKRHFAAEPLRLHQGFAAYLSLLHIAPVILKKP